MNLKAVMLIVGLASAIATTASAFAYMPILCTETCFDLLKNPDTKGYDPKFLDQPLVKTSCLESHSDLTRVGLKDLGYCDKSLGTL